LYSIKNNFFGTSIDVAGLVTGSDLIAQLKGKSLGSELLIPSVMLRYEGDLFLDNMSVEELAEKLNVTITPVNTNGDDFVNAALGI
jgi:NifB/MoaA-like Fe-S oxidoreductase